MHSKSNARPRTKREESVPACNVLWQKLHATKDDITQNKASIESRLCLRSTTHYTMKHTVKCTPPTWQQPSPAAGIATSATGPTDAPPAVPASLPVKPVGRRRGPHLASGQTKGSTTQQTTQWLAHLPSGPMVWKHDIIRKTATT